MKHLHYAALGAALAVSAALLFAGPVSAASGNGAPAAGAVIENGWSGGGWWGGSGEAGSYLTVPVGEMKQVEEKTASMKGISLLDLDLDVTEVILLPAADADIRIVSYANWDMDEVEKPVVTTADGTLRIQSGKRMTPWEKGWFAEKDRGRPYRDSRRQKLELYLPEAYRGALQCALDAASIEAAAPLTLESVRLDLDAASAEFSKLDVKAFDLDLDAASVTVKGLTVDTCRLDVDAASAELYNVAVKQSLKIDCDAGTVDCEMAKGSSFAYVGKWTFGSVDTYFSVASKESGKWGNKGAGTATVGKGGPTLMVAVDCGSVSITEAK